MGWDLYLGPSLFSNVGADVETLDVQNYALVLYVVHKHGSVQFYGILHHSPFTFDHPLKVWNDIAKEMASKVMYIPEKPSVLL